MYDCVKIKVIYRDKHVEPYSQIYFFHKNSRQSSTSNRLLTIRLNIKVMSLSGHILLLNHIRIKLNRNESYRVNVRLVDQNKINNRKVSERI